MSYSGDVSCLQCWDALQENTNAHLVDVRTYPEWNFVGVPDLSGIGKRVITIDWQQFPQMQINADFALAVNRAMDDLDGGKETALYCLCRSGVRSISAATALVEAGYENAFNVLGGFEGDKDERGHRGKISGWKFDDLPWVQG